MTNDVKERVAREMFCLVYRPELWETADCRDRFLTNASAALSALRPGDEIGECVLVPKIDILDAVRADGATERDCEIFMWVEDALYCAMHFETPGVAGFAGRPSMRASKPKWLVKSPPIAPCSPQ